MSVARFINNIPISFFLIKRTKRTAFKYYPKQSNEKKQFSFKNLTQQKRFILLMKEKYEL
ncbi:hypothetical protein KHA80_18050 [Anaerobacillus sp. HL2]|nr:hypothetical protein KHA80_18050 [Anaerobacillus sp. HL2]